MTKVWLLRDGGEIYLTSRISIKLCKNFEVKTWASILMIFQNQQIKGAKRFFGIYLIVKIILNNGLIATSSDYFHMNTWYRCGFSVIGQSEEKIDLRRTKIYPWRSYAFAQSTIHDWRAGSWFSKGSITSLQIHVLYFKSPSLGDHIEREYWGAKGQQEEAQKIK